MRDQLDMSYMSFSSDRPVEGGGAKQNAAVTPSTPPSVEDAVGFVQMVKEAFKERHPDRYRLFLRVMDDFRNQRVGIAEVTTTARALFRDTPDLALGFNTFLPKGHRDRIQQDGLDLDDVAAYLIRDMNLDDDDDGH